MRIFASLSNEPWRMAKVRSIDEIIETKYFNYPEQLNKVVQGKL